MTGEDKVVIADDGRIAAPLAPASMPSTVGSLLWAADRHSPPQW
jgi:hypothetical protein